MELIINFAYIVSTFLFIYGLKKLGSPESARKGNLYSALGMFVAIVVTLLDQQIISYQWIIMGMLIGSVIGVVGARLVAMTSMPEMVALLNGFGGVSSLLVGWAVYLKAPHIGLFESLTILSSIIIGGVTFTGSIIAWAKLSETISGKALIFKGQQLITICLVIGMVGCSIWFCLEPEISYSALIGVLVLANLCGIALVVSIGGGDMPVVIALLNSYSGLAACAAGFVLHNNLLIVSGSLVGASGIILTNIMCKAMNRTLTNVLFGGFGATTGGKQVEGDVKPISAEDSYYILESAASVVIVPGYGLAVAQAQHAVKELGNILEEKGVEVKYAIHPVAGRMPGHMNVLLAEADISYDKLVEMDDVNPTIESVDVCVVIGANDVVNPSAREDESSAIYGMPIIDVDKAKTVIVLKRGMSAGFAGIQNPLFFNDNTRMLFGDAKQSVQGLITHLK